MTEPELAPPNGYRELLEDLKRTVAATRWRTQRTVNTELLTLYWRLGDAVLQRQHAKGWGTRVIDRLATDLRAAFPTCEGCPGATSSTCGRWPAPGQRRQSANSLLANCLGVTSSSCLTRSTTRASGTTTPQRPYSSSTGS